MGPELLRGRFHHVELANPKSVTFIAAQGAVGVEEQEYGLLSLTLASARFGCPSGYASRKTCRRNNLL